MAFVVEDGTGINNANSYATVAEFVTLMEDMGNTTQAEADDEQIEVALVKATQYMVQKFRLLWKGSRATEQQRLDWPRRGVDVPDFFDPFFRDLSNIPISFQDTLFIPENEVPYEVKAATILCAFETFTGAVSDGVIQPALGRSTKREKLGVMEVEYFGEGLGTGRQTQKYWNVEQTVEPFLNLTRLHGGQLLRN